MLISGHKLSICEAIGFTIKRRQVRTDTAVHKHVVNQPGAFFRNVLREKFKNGTYEDIGE